MNQSNGRIVGPPKIIGIDPGLRACGLAVWDGHSMLARTLRPKTQSIPDRIRELCDCHLGGLRAQIVVIEKPQVYQGHKAPGDPNDLIHLAMLVGALIRHLDPPHLFLPTPAQWKGQTPKEISHQRIQNKVQIRGSTSKDALDAVGLCLWGIDHA